MEGKGLVAELQRAAICPACRGHFKDPVILDCDHSYCRACITRYWDEETAKGNRVLSCPLCKKVFERRNLRTNVKLAPRYPLPQSPSAAVEGGDPQPASRKKRKASENSAAVMVTWQNPPARRLMAGKKQGQNSESNTERTNKAALYQLMFGTFTTHFHLNIQPELFQVTPSGFQNPLHGKDGEINVAASPEFWTH
ncbi:RING finger protein 39 [Crotalus adamanteus]|uniref:RING finger protein 39 n=1 Tax=Crotalus adamanteus TaxID=8729 RepID=A0AAW1BU27_CROAD